MKKLYQCPDCGAIYLKDCATGNKYWQPLSCFEQSALFILLRSEPLTAITDVIKVIKTHLCNKCNFDKNIETHLN